MLSESKNEEYKEGTKESEPESRSIKITSVFQRLLRNWDVVFAKNRDPYEGIMAREAFIRCFDLFRIAHDQVLDVSDLRIKLAGKIFGDEEHPEYMHIGMRTNYILGLRRTGDVIGKEDVYEVLTVSGSKYKVIWSGMDSDRWSNFKRLSHYAGPSLLSVPREYRVVADFSEIPRIITDNSPTQTIDLRAARNLVGQNF